MKRKFLVILLAIASALCLVFGLSACAGIGGGSNGSSGSSGSGGSGGSGGSDGGHTHHFVYVYNDDATCTEDGTETEHCDSCDATGETRVKEGTKLGHNMVQLPAQSATCSECGYLAHIGCSRCGFTEESIKYTDALHVKYELSDNHYIVSDLNSACTDTEIVIPATYKGLPVTSIGERAFYGCRTLTSITIPAGVTSIGERAFARDYGYNSPLTSITIPASVTSIGQAAFDYCSSLNAVYITDLEAWCGIDFDTSYVYYANPLFYAHHLYVDGQEVTDLRIPDGVKEIKNYAFEGGAFTSVTIPEGVISIGEYAFYDCSSLTSITIPASVTSIESCAFHFCIKLTSITIPASVTAIGINAFYGTAFYNDDANWISDVLYIGDYLIEAKSTISGTCNIREGTKLIANYAFRDCSWLRSITIPASVISIGKEAFSGCNWLTSITIPASVTSIGEHAFVSCSMLTSVTFEGDSQLTSIGFGAFNGCSSLISITIPEGVTSIENFTFADCSSLQSVTIPASVTSIGAFAFNCWSLKRVQFERTDGWKVSGYSDMSGAIDVAVSDPQTAAQYLRGPYCNWYWERT